MKVLMEDMKVPKNKKPAKYPIIEDSERTQGKSVFYTD